jgi:hypothetical protein
MAHTTTRPNPPVNEVMTHISDEITRGSSLPVPDASLAWIVERYRTPVGQRLEIPDSWRREGANVLTAAHQIGVIASAIAKLHKEREIVDYVIEAAAGVVEEHCHIAYGEGRWCERP